MITFIYLGSIHLHSMHMEMKGQPVGNNSFLPLCRSQGLSLGFQSWWQVPLSLSHPSC